MKKLLLIIMMLTGATGMAQNYGIFNTLFVRDYLIFDGDTVSFWSNEIGSNSIYYADSVGINKTAVDFPLDVEGDMNISGGSAYKIGGADIVTETKSYQWDSAYNWGDHPWEESGADIYYNSGNVGIGTVSPAYKLDADGNINISTGHAYKINGTDVLTSTLATQRDAAYTHSQVTSGNPHEVKWTELEGSQVDVDISGFNNDAGYISSETDPTWNGSANTSSGISRSGDVDITGTLLTNFPTITEQHASYTRQDIINTSQNSQFVAIEFQTQEFMAQDFSLASDGLSIRIDDDGVFRVSITGHWQWDGEPNTSVIAHAVVLVDNNETPLTWTMKRTCDEGDFGTLNINGLINVSSGEKVSVKYYVSSTDMNFRGQPVFDHPDSFKIEFNKVSTIL